MAKHKTPVSINTAKARRWDVAENFKLQNAYAVSRLWHEETKDDERVIGEATKRAVINSLMRREVL